MAKINEIVINGFKAFPSLYKIELGGKHLLMYGENGSGKSSIYYALHCIFNSYRKPDNGKKYFDKNNSQNLINRFFIPKDERDIPYVAVNWYDGGRNVFLSAVSEEERGGSARLAELETYFVNHNLLNGFFNFTNSNSINLFPIFQREILPYKFVDEYSTYMSLMYEQIQDEASKLNNRSSTKKINEMIDIFNSEIENFIGDINIVVSDIYKNYFKTEDDKDLSIVLTYPKENPNPDVYIDGFRLKWDNRLIRNQKGELERAPNKSLIEPIIGIEIKEDGVEIPKPQVYFNEAKLTAIALSIRFALLKGINNDDDATPPEGSFLALDDMLISLDMSNRAKVVDFLLKISDKYKIYLFTHDRAFFEHFKERIYFANKSKGVAKEDGWLFKELYNDDTPTNNPKDFNSESDIARARKHYKEFDYPAAANYLRKAVEVMVNEVFPPKLSKQNDGAKHERLRNVLEISFDFFSKIQGFDLADLSRLIANLNLLMNPLSHKSTETNVYKIELKEIFAIIERLSLQVQELSIEEVLPRKEKVYLHLKEDEHITQKYEIELQQELYKYIVAETIGVTKPEAKSTRSCTITDGVEGEYNRNERYKGSLEKICQDIYNHKGKEYTDNYLELYRDKNNNVLNSIL
ncbi:MAG: AAA family ATPase [Lachnospiraceae bacterium]|nr:AAA family ATPase [Lachnospiraceae bacterium]